MSVLVLDWLQVATGDGIPLPFAGDGWTDDLGAVFGVGPDIGPVPDWVADRAAVATRLLAKQDRDADACVWRGIARLLAVVRALPSDTLLDEDAWQALFRAFAVADVVSGGLPAPHPRVVELPAQPAPGEEAASGPSRFVIDRAGRTLADLLSETAWVDPDVLAGAVEDVRDGLADYALAACAWERAALADARGVRTARVRAAPGCPVASYGRGTP